MKYLLAFMMVIWAVLEKPRRSCAGSSYLSCHIKRLWVQLSRVISSCNWGWLHSSLELHGAACTSREFVQFNSSIDKESYYTFHYSYISVWETTLIAPAPPTLRGNVLSYLTIITMHLFTRTVTSLSHIHVLTFILHWLLLNLFHVKLFYNSTMFICFKNIFLKSGRLCVVNQMGW